jgi:Flp pilus assembly pilin Flp
MANLRDWLDQLRARLCLRERGQGLMEYGLIISVVSIAAVVLVMAMGPRVASMFSSAGQSFSSDRRRKGGFAAVNSQDVLARAAALPVHCWAHTDQDRAIRHVGPAAQDFQAAFGLGDDNADVALVDANGVALASIQGLYYRVDTQQTHLATLSRRLAALDAAGRRKHG